MIHWEAEVVKPEDVRISLTLTMSAGEWEQIVDTLPSDKHPDWMLRSAILKAVRASLTKVSGKHEGEA